MFQDKIYSNRIQKFKKKIETNTLYLISNPKQISYFTGFDFMVSEEREAFFICGANISALIYASFSTINNYNFLNYFPGIFPSQLKEHLEEIIKDNKINQIIYDDDSLFVSEFKTIKSIKKIKLKSIDNNLIPKQMSIKDFEEIKLIKKACKITSEVFQIVKQKIKIGMTELEVVNLIRQEFESKHITDLAFPTIVAFNENCARPHHKASNKKLKKNNTILIDMGAKYKGYCADMTRTFWFGENPSKKFNDLEKIVNDAYKLALELVRQHQSKKIIAKNIDNAARVHISNSGYADNFIHTTGHGLGLNIHEFPALSWRSTDQLLENMVITIEPGIYIENELGYRHENTILITKSEIKVLT